MVNYSFNHLLGTKDDGTKTARLELLRDGSILTSFNSPEDVQGFILAVTEARNYLDDIAQQTHLHCTPSSAPTVFANLDIERAEIESIRRAVKPARAILDGLVVR